MKKFFVYIMLFLVVLIGNSLQADAQNSNQKITLQGGVQTNVPRTPSEITIYLKKMNLVMKEYDALSNKLATVLMTGGASSGMASSARNEWIRIANKIDNIIPPAELKFSHKGLASSLRKSSKFLTSISGATADQKQQVMMAMMPVVGELGNSVTTYSTQVDMVCDEYGLSRSLNPISKSGAFKSTGLGSTMDLKSIMGGLGGLSGAGLGF